jgi:hypothetical protein
MRDPSYDAPGIARKSRAIMGKAVDPATPEAYVKSFAIAKGRSMTLSRRFRVALVLPAISFVAPGAWEPSVPAQKAVGERMEYEVLMGQRRAKSWRAPLPPKSWSRHESGCRTRSMTRGRTARASASRSASRCIGCWRGAFSPPRSRCRR